MKMPWEYVTTNNLAMLVFLCFMVVFTLSMVLHNVVWLKDNKSAAIWGASGAVVVLAATYGYDLLVKLLF